MPFAPGRTPTAHPCTPTTAVVAWVDAKRGPCITLGLLLLILMTLASFCPFFFPPFFLADTSLELGLGRVIIACAGAFPGTCRCHLSNPPMGSSQGIAVPWGGGSALPRGWGRPPSSAQPPPMPQSRIAPEDFSLGNSLKKNIVEPKKTKKPTPKPTTRKEKNHKQPPGKFSGESLKKQRERGKKKEQFVFFFFPRPKRC